MSSELYYTSFTVFVLLKCRICLTTNGKNVNCENKNIYVSVYAKGQENVIN